MKHDRAHIVLWLFATIGIIGHNFWETTNAVEGRKVVMDPTKVVPAFLIGDHWLNSVHHRGLSPLRALIAFGRFLRVSAPLPEGTTGKTVESLVIIHGIRQCNLKAVGDLIDIGLVALPSWLMNLACGGRHYLHGLSDGGRYRLLSIGHVTALFGGIICLVVPTRLPHGLHRRMQRRLSRHPIHVEGSETTQGLLNGIAVEAGIVIVQIQRRNSTGHGIRYGLRHSIFVVVVLGLVLQFVPR
mmetsp:Transcript_9846/g.27574  ORF Transcript_9846/g.27574 Transcript_9846/m.27574 type:complete len:242 (-) Transcript_9846:633-1358(-)